jgi:hypothetical protein
MRRGRTAPPRELHGELWLDRACGGAVVFGLLVSWATYFALLLAHPRRGDVELEALLGAALGAVAPFVAVSVARLEAGRSRRRRPSILAWVVPLIALYLAGRWGPGPVFLCGFAMAHGYLTTRAREDAAAAWAAGVGPLIAVVALDLTAEPAFLIGFALSLLASVAIVLLVQARHARRRVRRRTPRAAGRLALPDEPRVAILRRVAVAIPLTIALLVLLPPLHVTLHAVKSAVPSADEPVASQQDEAEQPDDEPRGGGGADAAASARQAFDRIIPTNLGLGGGVTRLEHEVVMFVRPLSNARFPLRLRGMVFDEITEAGAEFTGGAGLLPRSSLEGGLRREWNVLDDSAQGPFLELEIVQQPLLLRDATWGLLFAPQPVAAIDAPDVLFDPDGLLVVPDAPTDWFRYRVQAPAARPTRAELAGARARHPDERTVQLPRPSDDLSYVADLARRVTRDAADDEQRVHAVLAYFLRNFEYDLASTRFPGLAGVVEFLERRRGHCTYYASASVLLLRSLGISARVATGFLAADWSEEQGAYEVTTRNGHAWIEVYFEDAGWLTYDPTPSDRREQALAAAARGDGTGLAAWAGDLASDLRLWVASGGNALHLGELGRRLRAGPAAVLESARRHPLVTSVLAAVLWALLASRFLRKRRRARGVPRRGDDSSTAFGVRLQRALARHGLHRGRAQTLRELAARAAQLPGAAFPRVPAAVELLYAADYGARALSGDDVRELRGLVAELERGPEPAPEA